MWTRFARLAAFLGAAVAVTSSLAHGEAAVSSEMTCHEFPVVIVSAKSGAFPDPTCNQLRYPAEYCLKSSVTSHVQVIDHKDGSPNCYASPPTNEYEAKTNYRGQTSLFFAKHQIGIKFKEANEFIGFPEDKDFVLNGPFVDCTLLRNHLAHWLYRSTGRYSSRTKHVAMYFSDTPGTPPRYVGIYLLIEKPGFGPSRVGLAKMDTSCRGEELNGGWAWHNDPSSYGDFSPNMVVDQYQNEFGMGERPILAYPSGDKTSQLMRDYFVNTTTGFLPKLYRFMWNDMMNPDGLEEHIDLGSFADYILHTELSLNVDAYRRSTYFHKDRNQTINAGPVWDLNLAYGNGARREFQDWIYPQYTFWKRLMCNYKLTSLVIQRWTTLRSEGQPWSDSSIVQFLDKSAVPIQQQLKKCKSNWRSDAHQCAAVDLKSCMGSYESRLEELKTAVVNRARWMDQHILGLYKPLDGRECSYVGEIPKYNCAADGNDGGCMSDPARYYNAVKFPEVRKPYSGPECGLQVDSTTENAVVPAMVQPSTDYCWLATGAKTIYPNQKGVREKTLTTFCGGYGSCAQGPAATCNCSKALKVDPVSCQRVDADYYTERARTAAADIEAEGSPVHVTGPVGTGATPASHHVMLSAFLGSFLLVAVVAAVYKFKQHKLGPRLPTTQVNSPTNYGSVELRPLIASPRRG